jgi:hypothetical protein
MCKNESMDGVCVEIMAGEVKCKYLTAEMSKNFVPEHKVNGRHTIITLLVSEQHLVTHLKNTLGFGFPLKSCPFKQQMLTYMYKLFSSKRSALCTQTVSTAFL